MWYDWRMDLLIAITYVIGLFATLNHECSVVEELEDRGDHYLSGGEAAAFMSIVAVIGILWPIYWTGRALYAVPEMLMLPPGDSV